MDRKFINKIEEEIKNIYTELKEVTKLLEAKLLYIKDTEKRMHLNRLVCETYSLINSKSHILFNEDWFPGTRCIILPLENIRVRATDYYSRSSGLLGHASRKTNYTTKVEKKFYTFKGIDEDREEVDCFNYTFSSNPYSKFGPESYISSSGIRIRKDQAIFIKSNILWQFDVKEVYKEVRDLQLEKLINEFEKIAGQIFFKFKQIEPIEKSYAVVITNIFDREKVRRILRELSKKFEREHDEIFKDIGLEYKPDEYKVYAIKGDINLIIFGKVEKYFGNNLLFVGNGRKFEYQNGNLNEISDRVNFNDINIHYYDFIEVIKI